MKRDSKQEKVYRLFTSFLENNISRKKRGWRVELSNLDSAISFWKGLSYADKKRLVSSTRWNHYPAQSWTYTSKKPYGEAIGHMIRLFAMFNERDRDIVVKNSVGVFAVYVFEEAEANEKVRMAKRLFGSPDKRIKLRAIEYSSQSTLLSNLDLAISRADYEVVNKMVSKIGMVNCYKHFIPESLSQNSPLIWWSRRALSFASRSEVAHLDSEIENCSDGWLISILLKKMPAQKALFYMNNSDKGRLVSQVIQRKLESI